MNAETYARVIGEWCEQTGMSPWETDADMHVEIDDATIGLIYDETCSPDFLHVFIDLGAFEYPDFHRRVLELNMAIAWPEGGAFALHPEAGSLAFHASIPLNQETGGGQLPALLSAMVAAARARLQA